MRKNKALETNQAKFERIARENIKREGQIGRAHV